MRAESCGSAQLSKTRRATDQDQNVPCGVWGHARWGAAWEARLVFSGKNSKWACGCGRIIGGPTLSQGAVMRIRTFGRCWISDRGRVAGWASSCAVAMGLRMCFTMLVSHIYALSDLSRVKFLRFQMC